MVMRKGALLCLLLTLALLACACAAKPETFSVEGLEITLTSKFRVVEQQGCTAMYSSRNRLVAVQRESFSELAEHGLDENSALADYAAVVIEANGLSDVTLATEDGVTYFKYENTGDGKRFAYLATLHKSETAFWLIQFAVAADDYDEASPAFFDYARSIRFDAGA